MAIEIITLRRDDMRGPVPPIAPANGCWICGGAVRRWFKGEENLSDVDVFSDKIENLEAFIETLKEDHTVRLALETPHADTYLVGNVKVQIIKIHQPDPVKLIESFDYNVCQFAWTETGIIASREAVIGTLRGHLSVGVINKAFAVDSLRRAFKYTDKGYKPCLGTIRDIANSLRELTEEEVKKQVEMSPGGGIRFVRFD